MKSVKAEEGGAGCWASGELLRSLHLKPWLFRSTYSVRSRTPKAWQAAAGPQSTAWICSQRFVAVGL